MIDKLKIDQIKVGNFLEIEDPNTSPIVGESPDDYLPDDIFNSVSINDIEELFPKDNDGLIEKWSNVPVANQIRGIRNIGNTCFISSLLQMLWASMEFQSFIHKAIVSNSSFENSIVFEMINLFRSMERKRSVNVKYLAEMFSSIRPSCYTLGQQMDVFEFYGFVCEQFVSICPNLFNEYFQGMIKEKRVCQCGEEKNNMIPFYEIGLAIHEHDTQTSIKDLIKFNMEKQLYDSCVCLGGRSDCNPVKYIGEIQFEKLPKILIFVLHRYRYADHSIKLNTRYSLNKHLIFIDCTGFHKYRLVSVVCHIGNSPEQGHYVCFRKFEDKWTLIDDLNVTFVSIKHECVQTNSYILCYEEINEIK